MSTPQTDILLVAGPSSGARFDVMACMAELFERRGLKVSRRYLPGDTQSPDVHHGWSGDSDLPSLLLESKVILIDAPEGESDSRYIEMAEARRLAGLPAPHLADFDVSRYNTLRNSRTEGNENRLPAAVFFRLLEDIGLNPAQDTSPSSGVPGWETWTPFIPDSQPDHPDITETLHLNQGSATVGMVGLRASARATVFRDSWRGLLALEKEWTNPGRLGFVQEAIQSVALEAALWSLNDESLSLYLGAAQSDIMKGVSRDGLNIVESHLVAWRGGVLADHAELTLAANEKLGVGAYYTSLAQFRALRESSRRAPNQRAIERAAGDANGRTPNRFGHATASPLTMDAVSGRNSDDSAGFDLISRRIQLPDPLRQNPEISIAQLSSHIFWLAGMQQGYSPPEFLGAVVRRVPKRVWGDGFSREGLRTFVALHPPRNSEEMAGWVGHLDERVVGRRAAVEIARGMLYNWPHFSDAVGQRILAIGEIAPAGHLALGTIEFRLRDGPLRDHLRRERESKVLRR